MRRRRHFKWQLGRPYFYHPWHDGLPTFRDWLALLFGLLVMAFAFKQYIKLGEAGWMGSRRRRFCGRGMERN